MTRDPGLQPERTTLAWRRTALSAVVVSALLVRTGLSRFAPFALAAAACALAVAVLAWRYSRRPNAHGSPRHFLLAVAVAAGAAGALAAMHLVWLVGEGSVLPGLRR